MFCRCDLQRVEASQAASAEVVPQRVEVEVEADQGVHGGPRLPALDHAAMMDWLRVTSANCVEECQTWENNTEYSQNRF